MSTCWISDPGSGGLTVLAEGANDGGGVRGGRPSPQSPRPARVRETLAVLEVNLQDDQLWLRGGQVRGRRRGIRVT